ncbi:MAG: type IV secretion system DNA-binding domain-containing protein [Candidatus Gracilibacteria bacterium]|nr:type IV secretion system DNA-binding domain-containing protein [Candidatus Gracilibacteria bacterium]
METSTSNVWMLMFSGLGALFLSYIAVKYIRHRANMERALDMVFLLVKVSKKESKEDREVEGEQYSNQKDFKEICGGTMTQFFESLYSLYQKEWYAFFTDQDFLSFEYAVIDGMINFFVVCPRSLASLVEKQVTAFYPDSYVEQVDDYNIFKPTSHVSSCYMVLEKPYWYPIKGYQRMMTDPLNGIINSLSKIGRDEGAAIQIMLKPIKEGWQKKGRSKASDLFQNKKDGDFSWLNPLSWISNLFDLLFRGESAVVNNFGKDGVSTRTTPITDEEVKAMEEKNSRPGFETIIRLVSASNTKQEAYTNLVAMRSSFSQYNTPNGNSLEYTRWHNNTNLVTNFIFRNFKRGLYQRLTFKKNIFSADELASIFHIPNIRFNKYPSIAWQNFKIAPSPSNIPKEGILLGHNIYRGEKQEIRMKREDRFRHFYVIGQTGTGKSSILQVMIRQDLKNGDGLCVVDPHGSLIEDILPFIPRERADDVIYFDPSDMERPLGLNLLEGETWEEKELVALDAMNIMIKLFDEEVFGPRIQDYFRNGCLTLMSDPAGASITDIVRLFTDDDFAKMKRQHVTNPIVASFWDHQMAKTGAREKQEMIPYFAAKFGQFVTNTMMRNIIGQTKSAFDIFDVMQNKKILLMNLSKGSVGEINSKLLGLIIVQKVQMAALRRAKVGKESRSDFFLYIDEFQNYVTDSIEVILSEARKYRLGLNIAHQYLAQLEEGGGQSKGKTDLKGAVFGNVGSMMAYKIGAQDAEFMAKEMAPVFSDQDLINIDKYKAVMKLSIDTQPSRPFSIIPVNPYTEEGDKEAAEAYKQLSRLKYGRDREFVDREILRRIGAI